MGSTCHDFKKGDTVACKSCGFEVKVTKDCKEEMGGSSMQCMCEDQELSCCGTPMQKTKATKSAAKRPTARTVASKSRTTSRGRAGAASRTSTRSRGARKPAKGW
jgi:hypothetical protein